MFLHLCVNHSVHRRVVSQHALQVVSQHALQQVSRRGRWYSSMPCRFPGPHPEGEVEGDLAGGVSRPTPKGKLRGIWPGGWSPGPHLRGGLQAHTQGGAIPACTEADPPRATAAGSMHPTGMHSCYTL